MTDNSIEQVTAGIEPASTDIETAPDLTPRDKRSMMIRSFFWLGSYNFERMQAMGFCVSLMPAIKRFYRSKEDRAAALQRHLEFFNTQPWVGSLVLGVTASLERKRASGTKEVDDQTITAVKVGLMGPLAGVGDPITWGTARPVLGALGASFALTGNLMGPLIFFFGMSAVRLFLRIYGQKFGYDKGTDLMSDVGGFSLKRITTGASVLGLLVMGALVSKWTNVNFPGIVSRYTDQDGVEQITTVQNILDSLLPGLVPLAMTFACMWLLKKNVNALWIIMGMFVLGIVAYALGIMVP